MALIANSFDPVFEERAGGHVHLVEVAKRWTAFDLLIFGPASARAAFERDVPGARFITMPSCEHLTKNRAVVFLYRALTSFTVRAQLRSCDAIVCLSQFLPDVVPAVLARPSRATVVLWHLMEPPWRREGSLVNNYIAYSAEQMGLWLVKRFFGVVVVGSDLLARQMRLEGHTHYAITTNGVEHLGTTRSESRDTASHHALFIGRLHPAKGLDDLIEAWRLVHQRFPEATLSIVGRGADEYRSHLQRAIARYGLQSSVFLRVGIEDSQKEALLSDAGVFVFPSHEEGWGIALAEAMAYGLPCVTYDLEIFSEIFPAGRLSAPLGDIRALAQRIVDLFENPLEYRRAAQEALQLSRHFSWERAAAIEGNVVKSLAGTA